MASSSLAISTKETTTTGHKVTTVSSGAHAAAPAPAVVDAPASPRLDAALAAAAHQNYDPLTELCRAGTDRSKEAAARALLVAAESGRADRAAVAVDALIELCGGAEAWGTRSCAARALMAMAAADDAAKARLVARGACGPLVALLRGRASDAAKEHASWALGALATDEAAKEAVERAGALPALVGLLRSGDDGVKLQAAATLWKLAHGDDARRIAVALSGAAEPLVEVRRRGSKELRDVAAGALCNLTPHVRSRRVVADALGLSGDVSKYDVDRAIIGG